MFRDQKGQDPVSETSSLKENVSPTNSPRKYSSLCVWVC